MTCRMTQRGSVPYFVIASSLGNELALPPRQKGGDGSSGDVPVEDEQALETHSPIGVKRRNSELRSKFGKRAIEKGKAPMMRQASSASSEAESDDLSEQSELHGFAD